VPLSGSVDDARAGEIVEALLSTVSRQPATTAIIDISGQTRIDQPIAKLLIRVGHTLKLIGTRVVLTGARPDLDGALAALGLEQIGVTRHLTLQDGVDDALQRPIRRDGAERPV
jgi:rsbT co-antagonist protein RsbR